MRVRVCIGDNIDVVHADDRVVSFRVVGSENGAQIIRVPLCYACDENDVDDEGDACPNCVQRAINALCILDAITHLIEQDERIAAVVERDNEEANRAAHSHQQYITLHDAMRDQIGDVISDDLVAMWAPSIANAMRAMGAQ